MWVVTSMDLNDPEEFPKNKDPQDAMQVFIKKCLDREMVLVSADSQDEKDYFSQRKVYLCRITDIVSCDDIKELTKDFAEDIEEYRDSHMDKIIDENQKDIIKEPKIWHIEKKATKPIESPSST